MKLFLLSIFLFLLSVFQGIAQIVMTQYMEIPIDTKHGSNYTIVNLQEQGMITVLESNEYIKGGFRALILSHYDTALRLQWQAKPLINTDHKIKMQYQADGFLYFLIEKKLTEYDIIEIDIQNGDSRFFKLEDVIPLEVTHFKVFNKIIFMGGEVEGRPAVLWFDYLETKNPKVLPQVNTLKGKLQSIAYSLDGETISLVLKSNSIGKATIYVQNYSLDGRLLSKTELKPNKDYNFLTFRQYISNANHQLILGTYGNKGNYLAQGFYVMTLENAEQKNIRFYDFSLFKNFFNYLSERQYTKLKEKISEKQNKGKTHTLDIDLLLSELIVTENELILTAEHFKASTVQNPSLYTKGNLNNIFNGERWITQAPQRPSNNSNMMMYNYKNAIIVAFDKKGDLLWDNSMEYKDKEGFELYPQTQFALDRDSLTMLTVDKDEISYKKTTNLLTEKEISLVRADSIFFKEAKTIDTPTPEFLAWYNNNFLGYGSQVLKAYQPEKGIAIKEIFYVAKFYCTRKKIIEKKK
jgi:hypothetical protein